MSSVTRLLLWFAARLMPAEQRAWAEAMRAEASYLPAGAALRWALGCVLAAARTRIARMKTGNFRISRWVMLVEMLACFGPLTLGWWEITFGDSGLVRHNWEIVTRYYMTYPGGTFIFVMIVLGSLLGLLGPIGLFFGLRFVASGRGLGNRKLGYALLAAPLAYALAGAAGYFVGPADWQGSLTTSVLFVLMPVACIAHLMYLARPVVGGPPPAVA